MSQVSIFFLSLLVGVVGRVHRTYRVRRRNASVRPRTLSRRAWTSTGRASIQVVDAKKGQTRGAAHRIGRPLCPRALGACWRLRGVAVRGGRRGVVETRKSLGGALRGRRMGRARVGRTRATFFLKLVL